MPRPSPCVRKLPLWLLLFGRAHTSLSLALPTVTPTPAMLPVVGRADTDFMTMYGFFDSPPDESSTGHSAIAHLPEIFLAMTQMSATPTPLVTGAVKLAQASPLIESGNPSMTPSAVSMGSPPMHGPGLVVLPTLVLQPTPPAATTVTSSSASSEVSAADRTSGSSSRAVILGSVIGSILLFTLCLFLLLNPATSRKLCCLCNSRKSRAKKRKQDKGISPSAPHESWVSVSYLPNTNDQTFVEEKTNTKAKGGNDEDTLYATPSQLAPPSKFSICSSEYLASPRDSAISATSESSTVKPIVSFAPGPRPVRPPRPPTADSPALSDSVYLACSDKPYVIVVPQPLSDAAMNSKSAEPPKRMLTPSEFFALHVPSVFGNLSTSPSWSKKTTGTSAAPDKRTQYAVGKAGRHSRTKSAPSLNFSQGQRTSDLQPEDDYENDGDVEGEGPLVQRLMKHRRSRSASGWAYPDRPKLRRN